MTIFINDKECQCKATTIIEMMSELDINPKGCAIAKGDMIIPRSTWDSYTLNPNDRFTLIRATQGG